MTARFLPNLAAAKAQARHLRAERAAQGQPISHSTALELLARAHGFRDWNTFHAAIGNEPRPPVAEGQIVPGQYLKQPFLAEVTSVTPCGEGLYEVTLTLAEPVDVVTFDSFSNFRSRIRKILAEDGTSPEATSDGVPHLRLWA